MRRTFHLGGPRRIRRDVDEELAFHLEMRTRKLIAGGLDPDAARLEARRQFGDLTSVRDDCIDLDQERERAMGRADVLGALRHDVFYALRTIRRNPGFAAGVIGMLALGIGANAAIFTLINAVLLRTLPVEAPHRLVAVGNPIRVTSVAQDDSPRADLFSYPMFLEVRDYGGPFQDVLASGRADRLDVTTAGAGAGVEHPRGRFVSDNYFQVLGVPAAIGRTFDGTEDRMGTPVVAISDGWWTRRFHRDPRVVGQGITINGVGATIIGVAPPSFQGDVVGMAPDLWIPLGLQPQVMANEGRLEDRQTLWLLLLGRLKPGATLAQVQSELDPFIRRALVRQSGLPENVAADQVRRLTVPIASGARGLSRVRANYRVPLLTLLSGVGILLLIICANVSNLVLARAVARSREIGVRMAIGAGRGRLVRQLLTESLVLGALGAAAGLAVAWWGSRLLLRVAADGGSVLPLETPVDLRVLGFTVVIALLAVVLSGLVPALRASRVDLAQSLKAGARTVGGIDARGQRMPLGRLLIVGQVALSLVLLIGAALFVRNLRALQGTEAGLDRDRLSIVEVDAIGGGYLNERIGQLAQDLGRRFALIPGVSAVTYSENGIFSGSESALTFRIPGFVASTASDSVAYYDQVGPGYFEAIGGRVLQGREFTAQDHAGSVPVALINETMGRFYYGDASPIGKTIYFDDTTTVEVVGVVADVKDHALDGDPVRRFYLPFLQSVLGAPSALRFEVRAGNDPAQLTGPIRDAITAAAPSLGIDGIDPLTELMRRSIREERLVTKLATGFGVLSLLLSAIGLYGVMMYAITRRTAEIGLRMALGARRADMIRMVLGDALGVVAVGLVLGLPLALGTTRILRHQLSGVSAIDAVSFSVALTVLALSAAAAALVPALRAARVAPVVALRAE